MHIRAQFITGNLDGIILGLHDQAPIVAVENADHTVRSLVDMTSQGADFGLASEDLPRRNPSTCTRRLLHRNRSLGSRVHIAKRHLIRDRGPPESCLIIKLFTLVSSPSYPNKMTWSPSAMSNSPLPSCTPLAVSALCLWMRTNIRKRRPPLEHGGASSRATSSSS